MTTQSNAPEGEQPEDATGQDQDTAGIEITSTDDEGSTFEPEEDPEGHAG